MTTKSILHEIKVKNKRAIKRLEGVLKMTARANVNGVNKVFNEDTKKWEVGKTKTRKKFVGLMGVSSTNMLIKPNGDNLFRVPKRVAMIIQRIQHWYAKRTWK